MWSAGKDEGISVNLVGEEKLTANCTSVECIYVCVCVCVFNTLRDVSFYCVLCHMLLQFVSQTTVNR